MYANKFIPNQTILLRTKHGTRVPCRINFKESKDNTVTVEVTGNYGSQLKWMETSEQSSKSSPKTSEEKSSKPKSKSK